MVSNCWRGMRCFVAGYKLSTATHTPWEPLFFRSLLLIISLDPCHDWWPTCKDEPAFRIVCFLTRGSCVCRPSRETMLLLTGWWPWVQLRTCGSIASVCFGSPAFESLISRQHSTQKVQWKPSNCCSLWISLCLFPLCTCLSQRLLLFMSRRGLEVVTYCSAATAAASAARLLHIMETLQQLSSTELRETNGGKISCAAWFHQLGNWCWRAAGSCGGSLTTALIFFVWTSPTSPQIAQPNGMLHRIPAVCTIM